MNPRSLIQPSEILPIELTGTHKRKRVWKDTKLKAHNCSALAVKNQRRREKKSSNEGEKRSVAAATM